MKVISFYINYLINKFLISFFVLKLIILSIIFRIHVLSIQKMDHVNPLLPTVLGDLKRTTFSAVEDPIGTRQILHDILQEALMGDSLAADFLICHLLCSVYHRQVGFKEITFVFALAS